MTDTKFMEAFLIEAEDLLSEIDQAALSLEAGNAPAPELVNKLFRAFHTIKGSSGMMGLGAIVNFTHHIENLLDLVREGKIAVSPKLVDLVLRSHDQIASLLGKERGEPGPDPGVTQKLISDLCEFSGLPVHPRAHNVEPANGEKQTVFLF